MSPKLAAIGRWLEHGEAFLGALFASCVCCLASVLSLVLLDERAFVRWHAGVCVVAVFWIAGLVYGRLLVRAWTVALRGELPFGPVVVRSNWIPPWWLRLPLGLWWLAHFLLGATGILGLAGLNAGKGVGEQIIISVCMFGWTAASNLFLALAIRAGTARDDLVAIAWRHRIALDALVVACLLLVGP